MSTILVPTTAADPETRLRVRLRQNAAFSALGGVIASVACVPLSDAMGVGGQWWVLLAAGLGLLGFAALVWLAASRPTAKLIGESLEISIADASWVTGSVVVVALGVFSAFGVIVMLAQATVVAFFGATQARYRREAMR
ncbi:MAG: hypothetical protein AAF480_20195 [Actinomycetota bacterium]